MSYRTAEALPIQSALPELQLALAQHMRVVLEAPPGAGKTTVVPLAMLDAPWLAGKKILMLEPRRIAARSAAHFMALSLSESVSQTVGYRIRFEAKISASTRIEVLTEGVLTRMLQDDAELADVGLIIFDEFHERHLQSDLALALALDVQASLRPELRILLMSATLDGSRLQAWLTQHGPCAYVRSEGKSYPVELQYLPPLREQPLAASVLHALRAALPKSAGDVLVFLPGRREIDACERAIRGLQSEFPELIPIPLHGDLAIDAQSLALQPAAVGTRKVVLATNVAESSLTLPGVRIVIDSGLAREPKFDPSRGFSTLADVWVSESSATQRAGRAGRVAPGLAIRLFAASKRLEPQHRAEILRADLAPLALDLLGWGADSNWLSKYFLDAPPFGTWQQAQQLLRTLGATRQDEDRERISPHGKAMLKLGAHPRLANLLLRASAQQSAIACDVVALLEARDPLRRAGRFNEDFTQRWQALAAWRAQTPHYADADALRQIQQAAQQWRSRVRVNPTGQDKGKPDPRTAMHAERYQIGALLAFAYPDRIARARVDAPLRYALSEGGGAILNAESPLAGETWLVINELDGLGADARIRSAAPVALDDLRAAFSERFASTQSQRFEPQERAVLGFERETFGQIVLQERSIPVRDASSALIAGIRQLGLSVLPWSERTLRLRCRWQCLQQWMPELALPDVSDLSLLASLETWIAPQLHGKTRLSQLQEQELTDALRQRLDYASARLLDQHAPEQIKVPSGLARDLSYAPDSPPILAVKLQELFGLSETPTVANGRIRVMLHLLSPGGKPVQVTQDLKNFWNTTYAEVKKEMKGRYPRHPWPDDPWTAIATHRAKPRGT